MNAPTETAQQPAAPDPEMLAAAAHAASRRFRSHGGGVSVVGMSGDVARVSFHGMCTGCPCRAQCLEATVIPILTTVPGVRDVAATGVRLDPEARERLREFLGSTT